LKFLLPSRLLRSEPQENIKHNLVRRPRPLYHLSLDVSQGEEPPKRRLQLPILDLFDDPGPASASHGENPVIVAEDRHPELRLDLAGRRMVFLNDRATLVQAPVLVAHERATDPIEIQWIDLAAFRERTMVARRDAESLSSPLALSFQVVIEVIHERDWAR